MRAMLVTPDHSVRLGTVPGPLPADNEALVAVEAYSVNRGETLLLKAPARGWRPGKDVAGTVIAAAADGSGPVPGSRVVGHPPHSGWAERVGVPTTALAPLGDDMPATTAAALPLAGLTALRMLRRTGGLTGKRVLITGASGGVGHYFVELATASGAEVVAVSATDERGARLREFGARTIREVTQAEGWFDIALDSVGGDSFVEARRRTDPRGMVVWFGQAGGQPVTLDFFDWVKGTVGARIEPFHYEDGDQTLGDDLATLVRLVADGRLHPEIGARLPWQQTARTIDDIRNRRIRGNAVLEIMP